MQNDFPSHSIPFLLEAEKEDVHEKVQPCLCWPLHQPIPSMPPFVPDAIMVGAAVASFLLTAKPVHESNDFFDPIKEVAWLFAVSSRRWSPSSTISSFTRANSICTNRSSSIGQQRPLSAHLDNARTYLTFLAAAMGDQGLSVNNSLDVEHFIHQSNDFLVAISLFAVFFGAGTYIGNGPNFMVKNIAQQVGVRTPTFFGYVLRYTLPVLLPVLALVSLLFFSRWRSSDVYGAG